MKLIPSAPDFLIPEETARRLVSMLEAEVSADRVDVRCSPSPEFVDCGSSLEQISCPLCGAVLSFDWWGQEMSRLYKRTHFRDLTVRVPCCGLAVSLRQLRYAMPCGFSCVEFDLWNPVPPS